VSVPVKTQGVVLLPWTAVTTGNNLLSSALNCASKFAVSVFIYLGRQSGTAFSAGWPNIRITASAASSGNDSWIPLATFRMAEGASIANTTLTAPVLAGDLTVPVAATTNIAVGDLIFLGALSSANWEIVRVSGVIANTLILEEPCTYAHANGSQVTDQAEIAVYSFDLMSYARIRAEMDNCAGGQTVAIRVLAITGDSVT
jgi:hypothetical protein